MLRIMLAGLVLALVGCQPGGAGSPEELATRYRQAHEARDLEALHHLVCWDRVDEATRGSVERQIEKELGRAIEVVRVEPLSEDFELEYTLDGVTYRPNLEPLRRLRIEFSPAKEGEPSASPSMSFLVGERDGTYLITTAAPVVDGPG